MRNTRLTIAVLAISTAMLTGCSSIGDALDKERSSTYEDLSSFEDDSDMDASWLPTDGAEIEMTRSAQAGDAVIAVRSSAELSPDLCAEVNRQSAPAYDPGPEVDVYATSVAFACGEWTVVGTDYGWLGWTPAHPDERAQSPS